MIIQKGAVYRLPVNPGTTHREDWVVTGAPPGHTTAIIAPLSAGLEASPIHPAVMIDGHEGRVMLELSHGVQNATLTEWVKNLTPHERAALDDALRAYYGLT